MFKKPQIIIAALIIAVIAVLLIFNKQNKPNHAPRQIVGAEIISQSKQQYESFQDCSNDKRVQLDIFKQASTPIGISDIKVNENITGAQSLVIQMFYTEKTQRFLITHVCEPNGKGISTLQKL